MYCANVDARIKRVLSIENVCSSASEKSEKRKNIPARQEIVLLDFSLVNLDSSPVDALCAARCDIRHSMRICMLRVKCRSKRTEYSKCTYKWEKGGNNYLVKCLFLDIYSKQLLKMK